MAHDSLITYYDDLADHYDECVPDWPGAVERHGDVLRDLLDTELGVGRHRVVDAACGIGTQALGLAARGCDVIGVDISTGALARARREAEDRDLRVAFRCGDLRALPGVIVVPADAVVCLDNSFAHLVAEEDMRLGAEAITATLRNDGVALIGIRDYDRHLRSRPEATTPIVSHADGLSRIAFQRWHWLDENRYEVEQFLLTQQASAWTLRSWRGPLVRAITRAELALCCAQAGLDVRWLEPATTGFHQPILVGRRRTSTEREGAEVLQQSA